MDFLVMFVFGMVCGVLATILFAAWYVSNKEKE